MARVELSRVELSFIDFASGLRVHGCFRQRLLSTNVCCQQTFTVNKSAALPNGSDQQNLNWTKGRSWQNSTEAVILVPKARGNLRLARANHSVTCTDILVSAPSPLAPEGCGGEKLLALSRIRTYNLQHGPSVWNHQKASRRPLGHCYLFKIAG